LQLRDDFTVASLLDSMDWMPDSMIAENIARLYPCMSDGTKKGSTKAGVIFWRSFATKVHSPVLAALQPDLVPDDNGRERVGWYLSQWIAPVKPHAQTDFNAMLCKGSNTKFKNTNLQDAKVQMHARDFFSFCGSVFFFFLPVSLLWILTARPHR